MRNDTAVAWKMMRVKRPLDWKSLMLVSREASWRDFI